MTTAHAGVTFTWRTTLVYDSIPGYANVVFICNQATNSLGTGKTAIGTHASVYQEFVDLTEVTTVDAEGAGVFAAHVVNCLTAYYTYARGKAVVLSVDTAGGDTYAAIIAAYRNIRQDFVAVDMTLRTDADIVAVAGAVALFEPKCIVVGQSDLADLKAASVTFDASAYGTAFTTKSALALVYCSDDTKVNAELALSRWLSFSPEETSATFCGPLEGSNIQQESLTKTERTYLYANKVSFIAPNGPSDYYLGAGNRLDGYPAERTMSRNYVHTDIDRVVALNIVNLQAAGKKLPFNGTGQKIWAGWIKARIDAYEELGHLNPGLTTVTLPTIDTLTQPRTLPLNSVMYFLDGTEALSLTVTETA